MQTYAREVLSAIAGLAPNAELSALVQRDASAELPLQVRAVERPVSDGTRRALRGVMPVLDAELVHGLDVDLPLICSGLRVATVHDLAVFDVPWAFSRVRTVGERWLVRRTLQSADVLIAVSQFTADRVHALSGRDCVVVNLAPAAWAQPPTQATMSRVLAAHRLPSRFVLHVGTVEPRKDVGVVAEACADLDVPFVLAGAGSTGPRAPKGTVGLGYVDVADLPSLYAAASVVAYSSVYEGFGLPPIEAMACGGAVVASAVGALPEVVGDGASLVHRHHVSAWVDAMRPLLADEGQATALRLSALSATRRLSWGKTASETLDAYRTAGIDL